MKPMTYTNAQLRSILNGLGYTNPNETDGSTFPLSMDDSPLTNPRFVQAIQKFQIDHQLEVNGIVDSNTMSVIQTVMEKLNSELSRVTNTGILLDRLVYDAETIAAVKLVQRQLPADGVASHLLRAALTKRQTNSSQHLPNPLSNPAHAIYLGMGDRDW